jgi:hypothetical protein
VQLARSESEPGKGELLPQPRGLKGLAAVLEEGDPCYSPVTKRPNPGHPRPNFDAVATPVVHRDRGDELASCLDELLWLPAHRFPISGEGSQDAGNTSRSYTPRSKLLEREKSKMKSVVASFIAPGRSPRSMASKTCRATSTFSCDIARAVSRVGLVLGGGVNPQVASYSRSPAAARAA